MTTKRKPRLRYEIECPVCHGIAIKHRKTAKYCSDTCRKRSWDLKHKEEESNSLSERVKIAVAIRKNGTQASHGNQRALEFLDAIDKALQAALDDIKRVQAGGKPQIRWGIETDNMKEREKRLSEV